MLENIHVKFFITSGRVQTEGGEQPAGLDGKSMVTNDCFFDKSDSHYQSNVQVSLVLINICYGILEKYILRVIAYRKRKCSSSAREYRRE